ncbi:hypothetical protein Ancab_005734 [Ancistrocladus abbreviatus]
MIRCSSIRARAISTLPRSRESPHPPFSIRSSRCPPRVRAPNRTRRTGSEDHFVRREPVPFHPSHHSRSEGPRLKPIYWPRLPYMKLTPRAAQREPPFCQAPFRDCWSNWTGMWTLMMMVVVLRVMVQNDALGDGVVV